MTSNELTNLIEHRAQKDAGYAIAYALLRLADATQNLSTNVKYLGNGDAATTMGAIEAYGKHMGDRMDEFAQVIGQAIDGVAEAMAEDKS